MISKTRDLTRVPHKVSVIVFEIGDYLVAKNDLISDVYCVLDDGGFVNAIGSRPGCQKEHQENGQ
jgi:hypothetical protein